MNDDTGRNISRRYPMSYEPGYKLAGLAGARTGAGATGVNQSPRRSRG
jgi:hypothetical protein